MSATCLIENNVQKMLREMTESIAHIEQMVCTCRPELNGDTEWNSDGCNIHDAECVLCDDAGCYWCQAVPF